MTEDDRQHSEMIESEKIASIQSRQRTFAAINACCDGTHLAEELALESSCERAAWPCSLRPWTRRRHCRPSDRLALLWWRVWFDWDEVVDGGDALLVERRLKYQR